MSRQNHLYDLKAIEAREQYDPGRIGEEDHLYITDMTNGFASEDGGLYVYDPRDPTQLHPDMPKVIAVNVRMLDLFLEAERHLGFQPPIDASEDAHNPHHPSHPNAYRNVAAYRTITRDMLDDWTDSDIDMPGYRLDDFKRHLDAVPMHTMHVYTIHGLLDTPDAWLISRLKNHPAKKRITPKGFEESPTTRFIGEQHALGIRDTLESTDWVERWVKEGVKRQFITGLCADICCAWQGYATRTLSDIEVVYLVDAMIPLGINLSPLDTTEAELDALGLDKKEWIAINPRSNDPLTLEQFWGAKLLRLGVRFSTAERLFNNMKPLILK